MSLKHLILAILARGASPDGKDLSGAEEMTGYEISRQANLLPGLFRKVSHQQVYRELAKLSDSGLAVFEEVVQSGKPNRKIYEITPAGREALRGWLQEAAPAPATDDEVLIRLFAGEAAGAEMMLDQIRRARSAHEERLQACLEMKSTQFPGKPESLPAESRLGWAMLREAIMRERAWLRWAEEAEQVFAGSQQGAESQGAES